MHFYSPVAMHGYSASFLNPLLLETIFLLKGKELRQSEIKIAKEGRNSIAYVDCHI
jgi:hypothetical protein